jgi:hypothetical protein
MEIPFTVWLVSSQTTTNLVWVKLENTAEAIFSPVPPSADHFWVKNGKNMKFVKSVFFWFIMMYYDVL